MIQERRSMDAETGIVRSRVNDYHSVQEEGDNHSRNIHERILDLHRLCHRPSIFVRPGARCILCCITYVRFSEERDVVVRRVLWY